MTEQTTMADITYDRFIPHVLPETPGCPDFTILRIAPQVVRDFCEKTHIWRVWTPLFVAEGKSAYRFPTFTEIAAHSVFIDVDNGDGKGEMRALSGAPYTQIQKGDSLLIQGAEDNNCTRIVDSVGDAGNGAGSLLTFTKTLKGADGTRNAVVIIPSLSFPADVASIIKILDETDKELKPMEHATPPRDDAFLYASRKPYAFTYEPPDTLIITAPPLKEDIFFVRAALKPVYTSGYNGVMPEWLFKEYYEAMANGIKSRILFMKSAKWHDPNQAANYLGLYQEAVNNARSSAMAGFTGAASRKANFYL